MAGSWPPRTFWFHTTDGLDTSGFAVFVWEFLQDKSGFDIFHACLHQHVSLSSKCVEKVYAMIALLQDSYRARVPLLQASPWHVESGRGAISIPPENLAVVTLERPEVTSRLQLNGADFSPSTVHRNA